MGSRKAYYEDGGVQRKKTVRFENFGQIRTLRIRSPQLVSSEVVRHFSMAVGFGVSVGDLIAVGKLAHDIAIALSDCRGASAEYRSLIELLGSLKTSLNLISNFISTLPVTTSSRVDQAFMNGILFHAGCCYKLLNEFAVRDPLY